VQDNDALHQWTMDCPPMGETSGPNVEEIRGCIDAIIQRLNDKWNITIMRSVRDTTWKGRMNHNHHSTVDGNGQKKKRSDIERCEGLTTQWLTEGWESSGNWELTRTIPIEEKWDMMKLDCPRWNKSVFGELAKIGRIFMPIVSDFSMSQTTDSISFFMPMS
jgi:hypothetical protein